MPRITVRGAVYFVLITLPAEVLWHAILGWFQNEVGSFLGITSPSVSQVWRIFVEFGLPAIAVALGFLAYHIGQQRRNRPQASSTVGLPSEPSPTSRSAVERTAIEDERIKYVKTSDRITISYQRTRWFTKDSLDEFLRPKATTQPTTAEVKFDPEKMELYKATAIESIINLGHGQFGVTFTRPIESPQFTTATPSVSSKVTSATTATLTVTGHPPLIDVRFGGSELTFSGVLDTKLISAAKDDFVQMPEATRRAYEQLRAVGSLWSATADRFAGSLLGRTREEGALLYLATAFATERVPMYGKYPPSRIRELSDPTEFKRGGFRDGGATFYYHGDKQPKYIDIAIREHDLMEAIQRMKMDSSRAV